MTKDLIERDHALAAVALGDTVNQLQAKIRAIHRATPAAMTPELRALVDLLREARDDLEAYVCSDYPQHLQDQYPSVARQYHRDMELCRRIDAALSALRAGGDA